MLRFFDMKDYLTVGYVTKPHGVKGQIKVEPLTDDVTRFKNMKYVWVEETGNYIKYAVMGRSVAPSYVLLKLEGVDTMDAAENFRGKYLWIPRSEGRKLDEGEYYWADIIGCDAVFSDNGKKLGTVDSVMATRSNDVYVIKTAKEDVLIPALKMYVTVDVENNTVFIHRKGLEEILPDED